MSQPTDHAANLRALAGSTYFAPTLVGAQLKEAADEIDRLRQQHADLLRAAVDTIGYPGVTARDGSLAPPLYATLSGSGTGGTILHRTREDAEQFLLSRAAVASPPSRAASDAGRADEGGGSG